jgi:hypothetical protein
MMDMEAKAVICQMIMSASTDRVMYSDTAPTPLADTFVPVEKDTLGMVKNVEISTSVKTPS